MKPSFQHVLTSIACALLLLTSACQPAATATPAGADLTAGLTELSGTVGLKQAQDADFSPASAGMGLLMNGQVKTGEDGRVRLDLSSGTIIRLVPSTLFTLVKNEETSQGLTTKLKMEIGKIFIVLNGGSMDVETPSGVASVMGSYMMVEVDPQTHDALITCLEGECSATNPAGTIKFTDGQKTILFHIGPDGKYQAPELQNMSEEDFQSWLDNNPEARDIYNQYIANHPKPTATTVPPTELPVVNLVPSSVACFKITAPQDKAQLPLDGPTLFQWENQPGATQYKVTFYYPDGTNVPFVTTGTSLTRYMDSMPDSGNYLWDVVALGGDGKEICRATGQEFSKPSSKPADLVNPPQPKEPKGCVVGQWEDPQAPCYCDANSNGNLPPYCGEGPALIEYVP
jgi:hypothetical protein